MGGDDVKRVVFYDTEARHVELKIRLDHDDMSQSEFFRAMVTGYISKNELILSYIDDYRESNIIQSKTKIQNSQKLIQKGRKTMQKFIIDEDERDNIFDLIAQEHPDL
jgi:hypothetical protein